METDLMALFRRDPASVTSADALPHGKPPSVPAHEAQTASLSVDAYARAYDTLPEAVSITDASGTIRYVNPAFTTLTGYAASEVLGRTPRILKSGRHDGFFYASLWRHLIAGHTWRGEIVNRRKDGALYVDHQVITPIKQADRTISGFISVHHERTQESLAEAAATRRAEELVVAAEIDRLGRSATSSKDVLEKAVALLLSLSEFQHWSSGVAFEVLPEQGVIRLVVANGSFSAQFLADEAVIPLGKCLCGRAAVEGRVLVCRNCHEDPRHETRWLGMKAHGHYTIPVRTAERVLAVINLYTDADIDASEQRATFLANAGIQLGAILDRLQRTPTESTQTAK